MDEREQVRPLAMAVDSRSTTDEEWSVTSLKKPYRRGFRGRKLAIFCGCIITFVLIFTAVIVALLFTVFKFKALLIQVNDAKIASLDLLYGTTPKPGSNMTLMVDVYVKNPNFASFKHGNTTSTVFFHGIKTGEARSPAGFFKPRTTVRMNISVDIPVDGMMNNPHLEEDKASGLLNFSSYSRIDGDAEMLKIIRKGVVVKINCSMSLNISNGLVQNEHCQQNIEL